MFSLYSTKFDDCQEKCGSFSANVRNMISLCHETKQDVKATNKIIFGRSWNWWYHDQRDKNGPYLWVGVHLLILSEATPLSANISHRWGGSPVSKSLASFLKAYWRGSRSQTLVERASTMITLSSVYKPMLTLACQTPLVVITPSAFYTTW